MAGHGDSSDGPGKTVWQIGGGPPATTPGSDTATRALDVGIGVAGVHDARLHLLSVVDLTSLGIDIYSEVQVDVLEDRAETVIDEVTAHARAQTDESVEGSIEYGSAVHRAIRSFVDDPDVDLGTCRPSVVMGTHGRPGLERHLVGSVAEKIVRTAPVPVLTVSLQTAEE